MTSPTTNTDADQTPPTAFLLPAARPGAARLLAGAALVYGVLFSFAYAMRGWFFDPPSTMLIPAALAGVVAAVGPLRRAVLGTLDAWSRFAAGRPVLAFVLVTLAAGAALLGVALATGRAFVPLWHDELSYLVQIRQVQAGRLWMPPHPVGDSFEAFHFLQGPVYASMYPPGTALIHAPLMALGVPAWGPPLLLTALAMGLIYAVVAELVDPAAALLAAALPLGLESVRTASLMVLSQPAMMALAALAVWLYLRWQSAFRGRRRAAIWAALLGACVGLALLTRPMDAAALALPLGLAVLVELPRAPLSRTLATVAAGAGATLAFAAFFAWQNHSATGSATTTLYEVYHRQHYPELLPGFHEFVTVESPSTLLQKREFHQTFMAPPLARHSLGQVLRDWFDVEHGRRAFLYFGTITPNGLTAALLPAGLLFLRDRRRLAAAGLALTLPLAYSLYAVQMPHYYNVAALSVSLVLAAAARGLGRVFPQAGGAVFAGLATLLLTSAALQTLPSLSGLSDEGFDPEQTLRIEADLARVKADLAARDARGLVLFKYQGVGESSENEPVYNVDAAYPDLARLARAHDLGPARNAALFAHYVRVGQGEREVFRYVRAGNLLERLGTVADLVDRP